MTRIDAPNPNIRLVEGGEITRSDADLCSSAMRYVREQSARGLIRAIGSLPLTEDYLYFDGWNGDQEHADFYERINRAIYGSPDPSPVLPAPGTDRPRLLARVVPYEVNEIGTPDVPYVLFYAFGNDQVQSFEAPTVHRTTVTIESRAQTFEHCVCVSQEILNRLRVGGKLKSVFNTLDDGPSTARGRAGVAIRSPDGSVSHTAVRDRGNIVRRIVDVEIAGN